MNLLFINAVFPSLYPGRENGWLLVEEDRIAAIDRGDPFIEPVREVKKIDCMGFNLLPGLIDMHVHGGMGFEAMDASPEGLLVMSRYFASHGVTTFLAATWTASRSAILNALVCIKDWMGPQEGGATLAGAYLEGPYLNPIRAGAQPDSFIRKAEREEALAFLNPAVVKVAAFAPEIPENLWLIEACAERGIVPALGHSDATYELAEEAARRGARLVTHCFNGMSPLRQRAPGLAGAALAIPELTCELIADRVHVHPGAIKVLERSKGAEGIILITDAIRSSGMPDGEFLLEGKRIIVRDSIARNVDGSLCGSMLTLEKDLKNLVEITGKSLDSLWMTSSRNAASILGIADHTGSLAVGMDADLVVLDENFDAMLTVVRGRVVHTSPKFL
jgi:N-acetylglucosamine-6-phosphate deacetylase